MIQVSSIEGIVGQNLALGRRGLYQGRTTVMTTTEEIATPATK
jgi:hypothetical protein